MPVDELFCKQSETSHGLFATDQLILTFFIILISSQLKYRIQLELDLKWKGNL